MAAAIADERVAQRPRRIVGGALLVAPGAALLVACFAVPLADMLWRSLTDPGPANYEEFLATAGYRETLLTTFRMAALVTLATLALGYPYAYVAAHSSRRVAAAMLVLVLLPFWSSVVIRSYAWTVWLRDTGIVNDVLLGLGVVDEPVQLIRTTFGAVVGMAHVLLPVMILPLYAAMTRVDPSLVQAAEGLGARPRTAFRRVYLPLTAPGIYAGTLIVFVLALGFYITPALLGDPSNRTLGELIVFTVSERLDFGLASAMGVVLLACTLLVLALARPLVRVQNALGAGD